MTMPRRIRRFVYFVYYLKQSRWSELAGYVRFLRERGHSSFRLALDAAASTFRYNVALEDYFYFRFYEKEPDERRTYAGTGFMYEFHRLMNPPNRRMVLHDKLKFLEAYSPFIHHPHCLLSDVEDNSVRFQRLLKDSPKLIVLKDAMGQCGWGVDVVDAGMEREALLSHMKARGYNLVEAYVQQHPDLNEMSPSGLNTVRIVTILDGVDKVHVLGAILRMTVNSFVDNIAMGNIAAPIDLESGKIWSEGVYKDITKEAVSVHPVTGKNIVGFQVPFWGEILEMTERAALHDRSNRSIGWDVAVTENGPSLIEGNHNWCKLLWQLPSQRGLKHQLLEFYQPE